MDIDELKKEFSFNDDTLVCKTMRRLKRLHCKTYFDCILSLSKEIEGYRNKIDCLEKELENRTSNKTFNVCVNIKFHNVESENDR